MSISQESPESQVSDSASHTAADQPSSPSQAGLRVLIADDHPVVRIGIKDVLLAEMPDTIFGEAYEVSVVLHMIEEADWDLLILDIQMPGGDSLQLLKQVVSRVPKLPVLVVSIHPEEQFAVRCLRAGAAGYLNKSAVVTDLIHATRRVLAEGRYVSERVAEILARNLSQPSPRRTHDALSDRELQVLRQLTNGRSIKEISEELNLSPKTVSTYRTRILEKLDLHNNAELVRYSLDHGLLQ